MVKKKKIFEQLKNVVDPELGVNIVDLGLIYDVVVEKGKVSILMTLTSPYCPLAGVIEQLVRDTVLGIEGVSDVSVRLTFDPPWTSELMNEEVRMELGFD